MSVSDPLSALDWVFAAGFPLLDCRTAGDSGQCNGTDTCGLIGRTSLCVNDACTDDSGGPGAGFMFPHMVNSSARPYGALSVEDAEAQFDAKVAAAFETPASAPFESFLDFSLVVYAKSLDRWLEGIENHTTALAAAAHAASSSRDLDSEDAVALSRRLAAPASGNASSKPWVVLRWIDNQNATWCVRRRARGGA